MLSSFLTLCCSKRRTLKNSGSIFYLLSFWVRSRSSVVTVLFRVVTVLFSVVKVFRTNERLSASFVSGFSNFKFAQFRDQGPPSSKWFLGLTEGKLPKENHQNKPYWPQTRKPTSAWNWIIGAPSPTNSSRTDCPSFTPHPRRLGDICTCLYKILPTFPSCDTTSITLEKMRCYSANRTRKNSCIDSGNSKKKRTFTQKR